MALTARALLEAGRPLLEPIMIRHGFAFHAGVGGNGSGGPFAVGEYRRGDRRLAFSCRWALGLVAYWLGDRGISHEDYMRLVVPRGTRSAYPGYGEDPLAGFQQLASDLELYCHDFLAGTDAEFAHWIEFNLSHPRATGLAALDERTS
jgi:hypothetical protein